jgi:trans-aconitate 2-methyltransferase
MTDWNPNLYRRFEGERTRPAMDLLARVALDEPKRVVDLGCGPGNSTELLAVRYPNAEVSGVDTSPAMVEAAKKRLPNASFEVGDAATWTSTSPLDVVYANAVFHWIPDHAALMPRLAKLLAPGGFLAFTVPDNRGEPTHTSMSTAARAIGKHDVVEAAEAERAVIGSFEDYWKWLSPHADQIDLWRTTYVHPVEGHDAMVSWFESTGLRPYLARLDADETRAFKAAYRKEIANAYPLVGGRVLLRFPRLFVVARMRCS